MERKEGEKISFNLFGKKASPPTAHNVSELAEAPATTEESVTPGANSDSDALAPARPETPANKLVTTLPQTEPPASAPAPIKLSLSASTKPKNVFAVAKKNPLTMAKKAEMPEPAKKMSEAERIMREEMERKRKYQERGGNGPKKMKLG